MAEHIAVQTVKKMIAAGKTINNSRVLVMGATFKENVSDIRNSKVADIVKELKSFGVAVDITDPYADSDDLKHEYGFGLSVPSGKYDAIILAVNHVDYVNLTEDYFTNQSTEKGIFVDVKGVYRKKINKLTYWSL
jgi:UDP-N-acetyl-D-galactosamine dehydrogenase